ncbi:hypothetical protein F4801DRAFT_602118 [Xylaria longipes]|nr:hypothetical protein F4801DRAFT_602118 [Xylaria longipes]
MSSESRYETRLKGWNARKNLKPAEWGTIFARLDALPRGTNSRVLVSGHIVSQKTINLSRRYYKQKQRVVVSSVTQNAWVVAALPRQVRIETQGPDGDWDQLSDTVNASTSQTSPLSISRQVGNAHLTPLPSPHFQFETPTNVEAMSAMQRLSRMDFSQPTPFQGVPESITVNLPLAWLQKLPSVSVLNALVLRKANIANEGSHDYYSRMHLSASTSDVTGRNSMLNNLGMLDAWMKEKAILISEEFRSACEQRLMSPEDIHRSSFKLYLLSAIVSSMSDLERPPSAAMDGVLSSSGTLNPFLLNTFQSAPKYISMTLALKLFHESIIEGRCEVVAQLLEQKLFDINKTFIPHDVS